jgi:hypothetical protein
MALGQFEMWRIVAEEMFPSFPRRRDNLVWNEIPRQPYSGLSLGWDEPVKNRRIRTSVDSRLRGNDGPYLNAIGSSGSCR